MDWLTPDAMLILVTSLCTGLTTAVTIVTVQRVEIRHLWRAVDEIKGALHDLWGELKTKADKLA